MELGGVLVHAEGTRGQQLVGPVAAAEEADAEHAGPPGGEEVPDGIADHVAVLRFDAERLLAGEEEVRRRGKAANALWQEMVRRVREGS